ncbi:MAG: DISARM system SNF2-like helicase DrmD [Chloroflexota bacterium]
MVLSNPLTIPEQGQIVTVRQRRYVVDDVAKSALPSPSPLLVDGHQAQHLIALSSIEDDALGETLRVVWELEPGAAISEKVALPEPKGFDEPGRLDAFLDAVRWGAISSADTRQLQAPFRSGIDLEDYQLNPLVRAIQMPRVSLLIADDVGLGKTIEAGMVIQELIVRNRARTVLVVCPAGLQIHWRDQMRDKFGLEFRIVDSELLRQLRRNRGLHVNPWSHFPRLITSVDFLKRDRPIRLLREMLPAEGESVYPRQFDILVVDEAHNVAPSGHGQYAVDSLRTRAVRTLVPHFEHKLFLTATPHNGFQESFSALLELLDNQRFARGVMPNRQQLEAVMVRRLKTEIVDWDGKPRFPQRRLNVLEVDYTEEERQAHRWLKDYTELRQHKAGGEAQRYATEFVLKLLKKRLFSSPAAFAATLEKHEQTLNNVKPTKQSRQVSVGILRRQIEEANEESADDADFEAVTAEVVATASTLFDSLDDEERELLRKMRAWADIAAVRQDSKTRVLLDWLHEIVKPNGKWSDERVIIFTEYRTTQNWLQNLLAADGLTAEGRLMTLFGGMDGDLRENVKAAFQASPEQSAVRILLATDAASEGIDLQNHCHRLVHFEIPWNPNRMEQRNGRIDRHGQSHDPLIYHFATQGYAQRVSEELDAPTGDLDGDLEFLMRAVQKVEQIREDLGKVGPVIAQQVEEAMLGRRRRLDTSKAESDADAIKKMLKFERDLRRQVQEHYEQLRESEHDLGLSPENIRAVVETALSIAGQAPLQPAKLAGISAEHAIFQLPPLSGSWAVCAEGLPHPHTHHIRPITFDRNLAQGRDDVVLVHLNHRLVQMAMRLLRAEVWSPEGRQGLYRVTARVARDLDTVAVVAHARLVVIGSDNHLLHEQIITAGGIIDKGSFSRMNVGQVQAALDAALEIPAIPNMQERLQAFWPNLQQPLMRSLEVRMNDRLGGLEKALAERSEKEQADIEDVLMELAQAIARELDEPEYRQLELFSLDEHSQLVRNTEALRTRLEQIPGEIEQEQAIIQRRFADPQARLFPVAVTFLVPERLNH